MSGDGSNHPGDAASEMFRQVVWRLDRTDAATLHLGADRLARRVRWKGSETPNRGAPAMATDAWLSRAFGRFDDDLRRGAVAAMAIAQDRRATTSPGWFDGDARRRLARRLAGRGAYSVAGYAADAGLACGLALAVAPFHVVTPPVGLGGGTARRLRRTLGGAGRIAMAYGVGEAWDWFRRAGLTPWAELHLDLRACSAFHPRGFAQAYRTLADIVEQRRDLAGVCAASWLYDPELARVSPDLAFVRASAEGGGARFAPVRTEASQVDLAVARSPKRAALVAAGAYRPACYAMTWLADDLIAWRDRLGPDVVEPATVA